MNVHIDKKGRRHDQSKADFSDFNVGTLTKKTQNFQNAWASGAHQYNSNLNPNYDFNSWGSQDEKKFNSFDNFNNGGMGFGFTSNNTQTNFSNFSGFDVNSNQGFGTNNKNDDIWGTFSSQTNTNLSHVMK